MKNFILNTFDIIAKIIISLLFRFKIGQIFIDSLLKNIRSKTYLLEKDNIKYSFYTPTRLNHYRAQTFFDKEPETIEWIDSFEPQAVFWDIGANIGLFSCYAAKKKNCKVFAFEPSPFNFELISKNIFINEISNNVSIIPIPLSNLIKNSKLKMTNTELGGALSTFGENFGHDGNIIDTIFELNTYGINGDKVLEFFNLPQPDHIKIDVDGIEHLILIGCANLLSNTKSVLIEVNENFKELSLKVEQVLKTNDFILKEKKRSEYVDEHSIHYKTYNQIWYKLIE